MSTVSFPTLTADAARVLTEEVKADAATLWAKLLNLYEGAAHTALGYSSWANYCESEFDMGKSQSYRVLRSARVVAELPIGNSPRSESVARELVPVLRDSPEDVPEVWGEIVQAHGDHPTATQVRGIVTAHLPSSAKTITQPGHRWKRNPGEMVENVVRAASGIPLALNEIDTDSAISAEDAPLQEWDKKLTFAIRALNGLRSDIRKELAK